MKIAYILDDDISTRTGVANKIDLITTQWRSLGHDVKVFSLRSKGENSIIDNGVIVSQFKANRSIVKKLIDQFKNIRLLKKLLEDYSPDIIYIRNMKYYPGIVKVLRSSSDYVVEINSKDLEESRQNSYLVYLYNLFTRGIFLKNARAFVAVSNELKNDSSFSKYSKECLVVANGYNFGIVKESKKAFNDTINFVFIATPNQPWHGVEKIIKLSKILNKNKFHIIGYNEEQLRAVDNTYNDNVITYGYLKHDEAEKIIVQCDIGI